MTPGGVGQLALGLEFHDPEACAEAHAGHRIDDHPQPVPAREQRAVLVRDREAGRELVALRYAEVVVTMLPLPAHVEQVVLGPDGGELGRRTGRIAETALPDFLQDLRNVGLSAADLAPLFRSAHHRGGLCPP